MSREERGRPEGVLAIDKPAGCTSFDVVAVTDALLGWRRPVTGGVMLLGLGLAPLAVSDLGSGFGAAALTAVRNPPGPTGVLYLFAELTRGPAVSPPAAAQTTPPQIQQPGPLPAGGADGAGQPTPNAGDTGRPTPDTGDTGRRTPGPDTPRRAA